MSNPVCSTSSLFDSAIAACFNGVNLSTKQRLALRVYFMSQQLAAVGGTSYVDHLHTTLNIAANNIFENANEDQMDQAATVIEYNNCVAAGAAPGTTIQTFMQKIAPILQASDKQLENMELTLRCQLGRAKVYPQ